MYYYVLTGDFGRVRYPSVGSSYNFLSAQAMNILSAVYSVDVEIGQPLVGRCKYSSLILSILFFLNCPFSNT